MFVSAVGYLVGEKGSSLTLEVSGDKLLLLVKTQTSVFLIKPQTFKSLYWATMNHHETVLQTSGDVFRVTRVLDKVIFTYPNHDQAIFSAQEICPILSFLINAEPEDHLPVRPTHHERRENELELL